MSDEGTSPWLSSSSAAEPARRHDGNKTRGRRRPISPSRVGVEAGAVSVVLGAALGVAWYLLSPEISGQATENGVAVPIEQARELFDRVAVFALLGAGIGLVLGVLFGVRYRRRPVSGLLALAAGGAGGSLLAWGIGVWWGSTPGDAQPGAEVTLPLELDAPAALLAWPVVGIIVMTILALFRDDRSPWVWNGNAGG